MVKGVYDTGSNVTLINERIIEQLQTKLNANKALFKTVCGTTFSKSRARLNLKIRDIEDYMDVYVVRHNNFSYDMLLGLDAIKKFRLTHDANLNISQMPLKDKNFNNETIALEINTTIPLADSLDHLEEEKRQKIKSLLNGYPDIFAKDKFDVGRIRYEAPVSLIEEKYVSKKPYRCSWPDQREIDGQIQKLLEHKLIEESSSPYASPVTLAYKREEGRKSRLCIDYRELNKVVIPESQPFPRIEDIMVLAGNCHWFSVFDINSAFWSIPLRQQDSYRTAFVTQKAHYQWKVLPFGLKSSSAIFQRILSGIIRKYQLNTFCINYIDDILIFSKTFEAHVDHIDRLMAAIRAEGFKLKYSKCNIAHNSVKYLGHVIQMNKVTPMHDNLQAIREFPRPKNKKNIRQLLGKINFYYKYIENAAEKLEPLHNLLRKNVEFDWSPACEKAFTTIKDCLCSSPVLSIFDYDKEIFIFTDASASGIAAILKQPDQSGTLHPVAYFSKKVHSHRLLKKAIYLECLAIKEAILYWQYWLIGRPFTVITDHKPLENLKIKARTDELLGDLTYYLSQYTFRVLYAPGRDNLEADALSRNPVLESFEEKDADLLKVVNLLTIQEIVEDQRSNAHELDQTPHIVKQGALAYQQSHDLKRIFISATLALKLIKITHEFYGHIGSQQMIATLRPYYYFKGMYKQIRDYCRNCMICLKNKSRTRRTIGFLSRLGPAREPFEIMSLDTVGGFNGNGSSKKYLHILADHFSRAVFIRTSISQKAQDFIKLIDETTRGRNVRLVLADQYSGLNSKALKDYLESRGIRLLFTSVDCASSNGLNERMNQTITNRIRCKINSRNTRSWPKVAEECVQEYNRTVHSVTKFSPDYLMYGKPSEVIPAELQSPITPDQLEEDRGRAFQNSQKSFAINKQRFDTNRRQHVFKEGDLVYIANGSKLNRNKLDEVRIGPYKIIKQVSDSMYQVDTKGVIHCSKLTPVN